MTMQLLADLRQPLMGLHTLVEFEQNDYEKIYGKIAPYELLRLLIQDQQFAWLHVISELIVRIDELSDAEKPPSEEEIRSVVQEAWKLLNPMEVSETFGQRYQDALQRHPDAVMAHTRVREILKRN